MKEFVEKLIERLEIEKNSANNTYMNFEMNVDLGRVFGLEKSVEIVNQLAEEYESNLSENLTGWIPVTERLPEIKGNYLVCSKDVIWVANYFHNTWWGIEKRCRWGDVEAWQPLPEPYKTEQQKEIPVNHYIERFNKVI